MTYGSFVFEGDPYGHMLMVGSSCFIKSETKDFEKLLPQSFSTICKTYWIEISEIFVSYSACSFHCLRSNHVSEK